MMWFGYFGAVMPEAAGAIWSRCRGFPCLVKYVLKRCIGGVYVPGTIYHDRKSRLILPRRSNRMSSDVWACGCDKNTRPGTNSTNRSIQKHKCKHSGANKTVLKAQRVGVPWAAAPSCHMDPGQTKQGRWRTNQTPLIILRGLSRLM